MKSAIFFLFVMLSFMALNFGVVGAGDRITFWTTEVERDRLGIQQEIAGEFTKETGIRVRVIPVDENFLAARRCDYEKNG